MSNQLQAHVREDLKRSATRKLREDGSVPAVVYGYNQNSKSIFLDSIDFIKTMREVGRNGVLTLVVEKDKFPVMLHDVQVDPLKDQVVHADFYVVNMKEEVDAEVTISLVGEPAGVKDGGVLSQALNEISVRALPNDVPSVIEVDVSHLGINDSITISDIPKEGKYEITNEDLEETIASVLPPRQVEEVEDETAAEETEQTEEAKDGE
ncbi:50S ribosomal protein L25/general stress protein Ctc [Priestia endophytica]|uniref:Large ribosomal subunit protein bL25 n=1 Tax=Priestia endophytica DSM 13796 TaxID=1121089 RepID=A0A1I6C1J5_9BACI|nr:50S ribosomal protein L25/general stress protein Ctc [Priestia endophytica]KAB2489569.1 50S ribosomal protein L25/general stress protein Ctc [Priestia endophytica]KYG32822.1 50S ribosomal protein L25/general stress protein Ctc [Priestia endophytica]MBG9812199.1 50S ribosomal protein L25 [Priestia endophytica]MCM3541214.1 50S ribosomal protein L25/general stress protein Ctc [Priestia endophytica]RAS75084.1 50S ribosomal protein L25/general stress protein Ctc [Priestia endophytica]